jgi:hypothetical protein
MAAFCDAREVPRDPEVDGDEISLEALTVHNAVEGCVRETFGALIATRQALVAHGEDRRAAFREIANDETRHAELAWKIHHWATQRLAPSARARISRAQRAAVAQLAEVGMSLPTDIAANLGLPGPHETRHLLRELEVALWA